MVTIVGYQLAPIVAAASLYYGIAVGYYSLEYILSKVESALAALYIMIIYRDRVVEKIRVIRRKERLSLRKMKEIIEYEVNSVEMSKSNVIGCAKLTSWVVFIVIGIPVLFLLAFVPLAVQLLEYRQLPLSWLVAPVLISIFAYTVGKYVGIFIGEMIRRPIVYHQKKEEYEQIISQKDVNEFRQ